MNQVECGLASIKIARDGFDIRKIRLADFYP
jgi:hypothetical protein